MGSQYGHAPPNPLYRSYMEMPHFLISPSTIRDPLERIYPNVFHGAHMEEMSVSRSYIIPRQMRILPTGPLRREMPSPERSSPYPPATKQRIPRDPPTDSPQKEIFHFWNHLSPFFIVPCKFTTSPFSSTGP
jgi:hypothetical protein